jgi:hypothetical protein
MRKSGVRSGLEDRVKKDLDKRGIKYGYESIKLTYTKLCCDGCGRVIKLGRYTPDYIIERTNGIRLVVECKGLFTSADREKHKRVKRDNPTEDIRFLFQRDQPIRKGSKTNYSDWSIKNGYIYSIGEVIPESWLNE